MSAPNGLITAGAPGTVSNLMTVWAYSSAEFAAMQKKAGEIAAQSNPPDAGTKHLVSRKKRYLNITKRSIYYIKHSTSITKFKTLCILGALNVATWHQAASFG